MACRREAASSATQWQSVSFDDSSREKISDRQATWYDHVGDPHLVFFSDLDSVRSVFGGDLPAPRFAAQNVEQVDAAVAYAATAAAAAPPTVEYSASSQRCSGSFRAGRPGW